MARQLQQPRLEPVPMRQRLVNARLLKLLWLVRMTGDLVYRRQIGFTEMQRRLITLLGHFGGLSSAELVRLTGSDKAQISRAVKALTEEGLISRAGLRSQIALTKEGSTLFDQIMVMASAGDASLSRGIGKTEMNRFAAITEDLTQRAALLLAHERAISAEEADEADPPLPPRLAEIARKPTSRLTVPAILGLVSYLQRSAAVTYKRETGISRFEWQVLSQIAEFQPISLAKLIVITGRDKSHVGRTLKRLVEQGAVTQRRVPGKRETILEPTPQGSDIYDAMCVIALKRDDFLFAELPAGTKDIYVATIDKLTANAEALLQEEHEKGCPPGKAERAGRP